MSNFNYVWTFTIFDSRKGQMCSEDDLTELQKKHGKYVRDFLAPAVRAANCGWSDLKYIGIKYPGSDHIYPYMVLYVNDKPERWIPVDGNSEGCNLQVLGENLW